ncbi:MAG TPA: C4-dicarboxylate transporter DcuC, partial [Gemmata sp.]
VCLGAVVVPLMRAAGYSMSTIGACLLLGASVGGELLNPGAPELLTVSTANATNKDALPQVQAARYLPPLVFTQLAVATCVLWAMSVWWERKREEPLPPPPSLKGGGEEAPPANPLPEGRGSSAPAPGPSGLDRGSEGVSLPLPEGRGPAGGASPPDERINLFKAFVPLVPLVLLFAAAPPFNFIAVPAHWVVGNAPGGAGSSAYSSRLIGLAMMIGVLCAAAAAPNKARDCVKEFFAGAGYGFANIISLIVIATCFGAAIKAAGLAKSLGALIAGAPHLMLPLAALIPLVFGAICGSGMASTQSLYEFFHAPALDLGLDPVSIGALVSLGSAAGRTMSPVAAVVLMCGTLTGTNPFTLVKRVAVPLLAGVAVVIGLRLAGFLNPF